MASLIEQRWRPDQMARVTGGLYLAFIVASLLASAVGHIGLSDADTLYRRMTSSIWLFRLGMLSALASALFFLLAAWALYVLLQSVDRHLALLFLLLNAVGVAVQCASILFLISALQLGSSHLEAYSPAQLEGLAHSSIGVYQTGIATAQLFFGTWLFPLGYLVYKSGFLPRFLGVLLIIDGFADLIWLLQTLLLPAYPMISYPSWALGFVAEAGLTLWLLIKGVKVVDTGVGSAGGPEASRVQE